MPMEKETLSFVDSQEMEYNFDKFVLYFGQSREIASTKYVLVNKYGSSIITITDSRSHIRIGSITSNNSFSRDTYRIIVEFQNHILKMMEDTRVH